MERTSIVVTSILAAAAVLAIDVAYVALIVLQGPGPNPYVPFFVSGYLALMAALIVAALIPRPDDLARLRLPLRAAAASGLLVLAWDPGGVLDRAADRDRRPALGVRSCQNEAGRLTVAWRDVSFGGDRAPACRFPAHRAIALLT